MEPGLVIGLSIATMLCLALLMDRLKLPLVLGMLIAGSLIGPFSPLRSVTSPIDFSPIIVNDPSVVDIFALIGAALILFGIGLEFSIINIIKLGFSTVVAAAIKNAVVLLIGYQTAIMLGFAPPASFLLAAMLSFSSTPIIIRILEDSGRIRRPEVPLIVSILIIEDFFAVFLLAFFSFFTPTAEQKDILLPLIKAVISFIFAYIILSKVVEKLISFVSHNDELLALTTISLVLLIGYFSQWIGLSFSVGAFLAGSVLATSPHIKRINDIVRPFNMIFASLFFFSIGLLVDVNVILASLGLTLILATIAIFAKFAGSALSAYLVGFSGRSSCFTAATMLALSEMSLLIAKEAIASKLMPSEILSISAGIIIVTSVLSIILVSREGAIYNLIISLLPPQLVSEGRELRIMSLSANRLVSESFRYNKIIDALPVVSTGARQIRPREQFDRALINVALFVFTGLLALVVLGYTQPASALLTLFVLIYLGSAALFTLNIKSALDSLYTIMFQNERSAPLLILAQHLASFAILIILAIGLFGIYLLFPKTESFAAAGFSALLSLVYIPKSVGILFTSLKRLRLGL